MNGPLKHFMLVTCETNITSMHSSRMRTARLLAVSPSMHCAGGVSAPVGGVSAPGGGSAIPACTEADPPVNRMTDRQV